jgi:hypothetical protein
MLPPQLPTLLACLALLAIGACGGGTGNSSSQAAQRGGASRQVALTGAGQRGRFRVVVIGHSVKGREILARIVGSSSASRRILVIGCVHDNEPAGEAITRRLRTITLSARTAL